MKNYHNIKKTKKESSFENFGLASVFLIMLFSLDTNAQENILIDSYRTNSNFWIFDLAFYKDKSSITLLTPTTILSVNKSRLCEDSNIINRELHFRNSFKRPSFDYSLNRQMTFQCIELTKSSQGDLVNANSGDSSFRITGVHFENLRAKTVKVSNFRTKFEAIEDTIGDVVIENSSMYDLLLYKNKVSQLVISNDSISLFHFSDVSLNELILENVTIGSFEIFNTPQPNFISIRDLSLKTENSIFDLTLFENTKGSESILDATLSDISKIKFNYINYKLSDPKSSIHNVNASDQYIKSLKENMYTLILEHQKKYGFTDGYEKISKEYKVFEYTKQGKIFGYFLNWLDKTWWDYGYNKGFIFRNTFYLILLFYIINLFIYNQLVHKTYPIQEFVINDQRIGKISIISAFRYAIYCLFYTGYVFFGLKLDFGTLKLKHLGYATYIIVQSVTGLICLAYIANYIISK